MRYSSDSCQVRVKSKCIHKAPRNCSQIDSEPRLDVTAAWSGLALLVRLVLDTVPPFVIQLISSSFAGCTRRRQLHERQPIPGEGCANISQLFCCLQGCIFQHTHIRIINEFKSSLKQAVVKSPFRQPSFVCGWSLGYFFRFVLFWAGWNNCVVADWFSRQSWPLVTRSGRHPKTGNEEGGYLCG